MKKIIYFIAIFFFSLILIPGLVNATVDPNWYDPEWSYRIDVTINHTYIETNLTDFPLLINITDTNLVNAQADGDDFLFLMADDATKLNHEIEYFNQITGKLVVWVQMNISSVEDTLIYLYYGNANSPNQQNMTATWASNYKMVQHLQETSGNRNDSTINANNGVATCSAIDGKIDGASKFIGVSNINCGQQESLNITNAITISAWAKCGFIPISTVQDLQNMQNDLEAFYILMNDINCSATATWNEDPGNPGTYFGFDPIGQSPYFTGVLDGNGFKITNLYINRPTENNVGLVGYLSYVLSQTDGSIRNLIIENATIIGYDNVGGLCGQIKTSVKHIKIININLTGNNNVGGIAGKMRGGIYNSYVTGAINGVTNVGGMVGIRISGYKYSFKLYDCWTSCNVTGTSNVGGLAGYAQGHTRSVTKFYRSYSTGLITGVTNVGGMTGICSCASSYNSFWDNQTSGQTTSCLGTGKNTVEMKQQATFTADPTNPFDFVDVWNITENVTYPWLRTIQTSLTKYLIASKGRDTYSLEMNQYGTELKGFINNTELTCPLTANVYTLVTLTYDGLNIKLFVNGIQTNSTSLIGTIPKNTTDLIIGDNFAGIIDEVRISNITKTSEWINITYNNQEPLVNFKTEEYINATYFNLKIIDSSAIAIENATVFIYDKNNQMVTKVNTSNEGRIPIQALLISKTAHKLIVTHSNYITIDFNFILEEDIDWTLSMVDPCDRDSNYIYALNYPMSYNFGEDKLTIWGSNGADGYTAMGNSSDNSITFENIYEFGRAVRGSCAVQKPAEGSYAILTLLDIGNITSDLNLTYVKTYGESIDFGKQVVIKANADLISGLLSPGGSPYYGSTLSFSGTDAIDLDEGELYMLEGSKLELYDTMLNHKLNKSNSNPWKFNSFGNITMKRTSVENIWYFEFWKCSGLDFDDVVFTNVGRGFYAKESGIGLKKLILRYTHDCGLYLENDVNLTITIVEISEGPADIKISNYTGITNLVNSVINWSNLDWTTGTYSGTINKKYNYDLTITDNSGVIIKNVSIRLFDVYGNSLFDVLTDSYGEIPQQLVTNSIYDYNYKTGNEQGPHKLQIKKYGKNFVSNTKEFTEKTTETLALDYNSFTILSEIDAKAQTGIIYTAPIKVEYNDAEVETISSNKITLNHFPITQSEFFVLLNNATEEVILPANYTVHYNNGSIDFIGYNGINVRAVYSYGGSIQIIGNKTLSNIYDYIQANLSDTFTTDTGSIYTSYVDIILGNSTHEGRIVETIDKTLNIENGFGWSAELSGGTTVNILSDNWDFTWIGLTNGTFFQKYTLDLKITDVDGNVIDNANATLNDVNLVQVFSQLTNATGQIQQEEVSYATYNETGKSIPYLKNPHSLAIIHNYYNDYTISIYVNSKTDLTYSIFDSCDPDPDYAYALKYPMSYNNITNTITVWGDDGTGMYCGLNQNEQCTAMGWEDNITTAINFDRVWEFARAVKGTCAMGDKYIFKSNLNVGNGTATTFFIDISKSVYFDEYHLGLNNCTFTLGELLPGGERLTKNGCTLTWSPPTHYYYFFNSVNSSINFYSSVISSDIHHWGSFSYTQAAGRKFLSYNSYFNDICLIWYEGSASAGDEMYRSVMQDVEFTFFHYGVPFAFFEDNIITGLCVAYSTDREFTYNNLLNIGDAIPRWFWFYNIINTNVYLIDTKQTVWTFYWQGTNTNSKLWQQYSFNLKTVDNDNEAVINVSIELINKKGVSQFINITNVNGSIEEKTITYGYYYELTGDTLNSEGPHKLQIKKYGKNFVSNTKEFTEKTTETLALEDNSFTFLLETNAKAQTGIIYTTPIKVEYNDAEVETVSSNKITLNHFPITQSEFFVLLNNATNEIILPTNYTVHYNNGSIDFIGYNGINIRAVYSYGGSIQIIGNKTLSNIYDYMQANLSDTFTTDTGSIYTSYVDIILGNSTHEGRIVETTDKTLNIENGFGWSAELLGGTTVNILSDNWDFTWVGLTNGTFFQKYTFDLKITGIGGNAVNNANATLSDVNSIEIFSQLTNTTGQIQQEEVSYATYNETGGSVPYLKNPHSLLVTHIDYNDYIASDYINSKTDLTYSITDPCSPDPDYIYALNYPMSYDAPGNRITVHGNSTFGTEANPITFTHIRDFAIANRGSCGANYIGYYIKTQLTIGNSSKPNVWVKDANKAITLDVPSDYWIILREGATFQLGDKDVNGNTYNGCKFEIKNPKHGALFSPSMFSKETGDLLFYASIIKIQRNSTGESAQWWLYNGVNQLVEIIDCILTIDSMRIRGTNTKVLNSLFTSCETNTGPLMAIAPIGEIKDVRIVKSYQSFFWHADPTWGGDCIVTNLKTRNNDNGLRILTHSTLKKLELINPDIDNWVFQWDSSYQNKVYRQYTYNLKTVDKNNIDIFNVSIKLVNKKGVLQFMNITNASGSIEEKIITAGYYVEATGNVLNEEGPHLLQIKKYGKHFISNTKEFTNEITETVALEDNLFTVLLEIDAKAQTGIIYTAPIKVGYSDAEVETVSSNKITLNHFPITQSEFFVLINNITDEIIPPANYTICYNNGSIDFIGYNGINVRAVYSYGGSIQIIGNKTLSNIYDYIQANLSDTFTTDTGSIYTSYIDIILGNSTHEGRIVEITDKTLNIENGFGWSAELSGGTTVNILSDDWVFTWNGNSNGTFSQKYTFDLKIIGAGGNAVNNASTTLSDVNSVQVFLQLTNTTGQIQQEEISYATYNETGGSTPYLKNPHSLLVTHVNYTDYTASDYINSKTDLTYSIANPCDSWSLKQINELTASGYNHENVSNYPMSWDNVSKILTVWGDNGSGGKEIMGYDINNLIDFERVWAFLAYSEGTCACMKESKESTTYTMVESYIKLGTASDDVYFGDIRKIINVYDMPANKWLFDTYSGKGHLYFGEVDNEILRTTKNGCIFSFSGSSLYPPHAFCHNPAEIYLYGTRINGADGDAMVDLEGTDGRIWQTHFDDNLIFHYIAGNLDIYDLTISNTGTTFFMFGTNGTFEKITTYNVNYAIASFGASNTVNGLYSRNIRRNVSWFIMPTGHHYYVDFDLDWNKGFSYWNSGSYRMYRQYTYKPTVVDKDNFVLENVSIKLINKKGISSLGFPNITNINGSIGEKIVIYGYYTALTGDLLNKRGPHKLCAKKYGKHFYSITKEFTEKAIETVALEDNLFTVLSETDAKAQTGIIYTAPTKVEYSDAEIEIVNNSKITLNHFPITQSEFFVLLNNATNHVIPSINYTVHYNNGSIEFTDYEGVNIRAIYSYGGSIQIIGNKSLSNIYDYMQANLSDTFITNTGSICTSYVDIILGNSTHEGRIVETTDKTLNIEDGFGWSAELLGGTTVNVLSDDWVFTWNGNSNGTFSQKYTFNLKIIGAGGDAINNANATLSDVNSVEIFSQLTNTTGQIQQEEVSFATYNDVGGSIPYLKNSHLLLVTHNDYNDYTISIDINSKTDLTYSIFDSCDPDPDYVYALNYSMSYDNITNTITVWGNGTGMHPMGNNESNPINFDRVWEFARAVKGTCAMGDKYIFKSKLQIGKDDIETYFADTKKSVKFKSFGIGTKEIRVMNNSHFQSGIFLNEERKSTVAGCTFHFLEPDWHYGIFGESGSEILLYSTHISTDSTNYTGITNINKIYNTYFDKVYLRQSNVSMYNVAFMKGTYAMYAAIGIWDKIIIRDYSNSGITIATNHHLANVNQAGCGGIRAYHVNINSSMTDCDIDDWHFNWVNSSANIYRKYSFDLKIVDKDGLMINDTLVQIWNLDGSLTINETTNINGTIPTAILNYGYYNVIGSDVAYMKTPHKIQISHQDYPDVEFKFNITQKTDWTISLGDYPFIINGSIVINKPDNAVIIRKC